MDCTKTLRLRIKDKHAKVLAAMAREVNQVFNFCNETSHRAIRERRKWLSGYDLQKLTNGFSQCDGVLIGSPTVQQVCEDYAKARKQFKKTKLPGASPTRKAANTASAGSLSRRALCNTRRGKSSLLVRNSVYGTATVWLTTNCVLAVSAKTHAGAGISTSQSRYKPKPALQQRQSVSTWA